MKYCYLLLVCAMFATPAAAELIVYQGLGEFGEVRFSQIPSSTHDQAISIKLPKLANTRQITTQPNPHCQQLANNLATLQSGGTIHEIDSQGNKRQLTTQEVNNAIEQIHQNIASQCQYEQHRPA